MVCSHKEQHEDALQPGPTKRAKKEEGGVSVDEGDGVDGAAAESGAVGFDAGKKERVGKKKGTPKQAKLGKGALDTPTRPLPASLTRQLPPNTNATRTHAHHTHTRPLDHAAAKNKAKGDAKRRKTVKEGSSKKGGTPSSKPQEDATPNQVWCVCVCMFVYMCVCVMCVNCDRWFAGGRGRGARQRFGA